MKVYQTIKLLNQTAGLGLPERYFLGDAREAQQDEIVQKLLVCCNAVLEELYCDYATDIAKFGVEVKNGFIDGTSLQLNRVISLTDGFGNPVRYRYTADGLAVENGKYLLTYAKLPPRLYWEGEYRLPSPRITERIFVYGVVAEYLLLTGDLCGAKVWEKRYQDALHAASVKAPSAALPVGKWL